jgi:RNA polymerase sigma factor (sigma-70 family)
VFPDRRSTDPDRLLVRACLAGDRNAWETLVRRYERLIYAVPVRCGLSPDDAADVFQTVCLKLLENLERLREHDRLGGWLATTANRECWRVQRLVRRDLPLESAGEGPSSDETLADTGPLPPDELLRLEEAQLVRAACEELQERCRRLLTLLYFTDPTPSYADIAQELGMPEGGIGPNRARCLQRLRKLLERGGF